MYLSDLYLGCGIPPVMNSLIKFIAVPEERAMGRQKGRQKLLPDVLIRSVTLQP